MEIKKAVIVALIVLSVVVASSFVIFEDQQELGQQNEYKLTSYVVKSSLDGDFPNTEQGSFVYSGNLNQEIIESRSDIQFIILFYSRKIPGLAMRYNLKDKTIEAGLPVIKSEPIDLFDRDRVQVVYSFKKGEKQRIILNGKELISSPYTGKPAGMLTGFVTNQEEEFGVINIPGSMMTFSGRYRD